MRLDVITIFPEYLDPLRHALLGKAIDNGIIDAHVHNLRDWATDVHKSVDDTPFGGGPGMVMKPEVWGPALDAVADQAQQREQGGVDTREKPLLIVPTPAGVPFTQAHAQRWAGEDHIVFACGRYEGIDQRVIDRAAETYRVEEVSIGDYVLIGGEVAVLVIAEAITRLIPGVIGNTRSHEEDSFSDGLLEGPRYTKPRNWCGFEVPEVLLSGNHGLIQRWNRDQGLLRTASRRPDLIAAARSTGQLSPEDELTLIKQEIRQASAEDWPCADIEVELERLDNKKFGAAVRDNVGTIPVKDPFAWANRVVWCEDQWVFAGIRFRDRDLNFPFVDVFASSMPPTPQNLEQIAQLVIEQFSAFNPLCARVCVRQPDAFAQYPVDQYVFAGQVNQPQDTDGDFSLESGVTHLPREATAWYRPASAEELADSTHSYSVMLNGQPIGVVAANREQQFGIDGYYITDLYLEQGHRGCGYGTKTLVALAAKLPAGAQVFGTIDARNTASMRNAASAGRKIVGGYLWVIPGARRVRTLLNVLLAPAQWQRVEPNLWKLPGIIVTAMEVEQMKNFCEAENMLTAQYEQQHGSPPIAEVVHRVEISAVTALSERKVTAAVVALLPEGTGWYGTTDYA